MLLTWFISAWIVVALLWVCGCRCATSPAHEAGPRIEDDWPIRFASTGAESDEHGVDEHGALLRASIDANCGIVPAPVVAASRAGESPTEIGTRRTADVHRTPSERREPIVSAYRMPMDEQAASEGHVVSPPIPDAVLADIDELEQVAKWLAFSTRCYRQGLVSHEHLVSSASAMTERLDAIRSKGSSSQAA